MEENVSGCFFLSTVYNSLLLLHKPRDLQHHTEV